MALHIVYLFRAKNFEISKKSVNLEASILSRIVSIGMASLIVQLSIVVIIAVNNNLLSKYGYETFASTGVAFGSVIPLAVVGIVMKVFGIVVSIVIGISLGGQPIIGFNMGAGNSERVKETISTITKIVLAIGTVFYLFRAKNFEISKKSVNLEASILSRIVSIGMASLIVQLSIVVIIAVNNNLLSKYGYETFASTGVAFGSVIPLAVVGIVMKVFGIVVSIVIGISLGGQPIIGFNMGAGNVERVKETISTITKIVLSVGSIFFLIFELAPDFVISLFGKNNSPEYTEYARLCVRIFLSGIILTSFIKSAAIMLQSLGKSGKSTLLALLRDVIVFVPSSIIMALISHNIVTMLWASLISDVISFIFAVIFIMAETRKITQELFIRTNVEF